MQQPGAIFRPNRTSVFDCVQCTRHYAGTGISRKLRCTTRPIEDTAERIQTQWWKLRFTFLCLSVSLSDGPSVCLCVQATYVFFSLWVSVCLSVFVSLCVCLSVPLKALDLRDRLYEPHCFLFLNFILQVGLPVIQICVVSSPSAQTKPIPSAQFHAEIHLFIST